MDKKDINQRIYEAIKALPDSIPVNYQDLFFRDPLADEPLKYSYNTKRITDLCADLGKYEVLHPSEITNEWMEASLYYTCDLLKKYKDTLWDMLHGITLHADDFWSLSHKFIKLCRDSEPDSSDKFEFLHQSESRSKCLDGKTLHEFMTEVVPSAYNITGSGTQFPVSYLTNRLLQHVALLNLAVYSATSDYGDDCGSLAEENNKTYIGCIRHIVKNNIWFNSFAYYVDDSVQTNCGLIDYYIYKEQKEKQ